MLARMILTLLQLKISSFLILSILSLSLSPAWAAAGLGNWSQMWNEEKGLLDVKSLFKRQDCALTEELFLEVEGLPHLEKVLTAQQFAVLTIPEKPEASRWFLIATGEKPNAGYTLSLAGINSYTDYKKLTFIWGKPEAGHMYTQAIVSPCLLIELPAGSRLPILVVDHEGSKRHRFTAE